MILATALGHLVPYGLVNAFTAASACSRSSAFQISARAFFAPGWADFRQRRQPVAGLVEPAALCPGLGEHLAQGAPEPERAVPDRQHRGAHPAPFGIA